MAKQVSHEARVQKQSNAIRRKVRTILKEHGLEDFKLSNIELVKNDQGQNCRFVIGDNGVVHKICD